MSPLQMAFKIHGMDCAEEVTVLKREVGPVVGGEGNLAFDILNGKMSVAPGTAATPETVTDAVARTGMRAEPWHDGEITLGGEDFWERNRRTVLTTAGGVLLLLALIAHIWSSGVSAAFGHGEEGASRSWSAIALYILSVIASVWTVRAARSVARRPIRRDLWYGLAHFARRRSIRSGAARSTAIEMVWRDLLHGLAQLGRWRSDGPAQLA